MNKIWRVFIFWVLFLFSFVLFFTSCVRSFLGQLLPTRERAHQSHGILFSCLIDSRLIERIEFGDSAFLSSSGPHYEKEEF